MRLLFAALVTLLVVPAAHAQVSAYALFTYADFTSIPAGTLPNIFAPNGTLYNSNSGGDAGVAFGALLEVPHTSRFSAGVDLRGSINPGPVGGGTFSAAAQVAFQPRHTLLRIYFEVGGGLASAHTPTYLQATSTSPETLSGPSLSSSNGVVVVGFGFDVPLPRSITFRLVDVNIGTGPNAPGSTSTTLGTSYAGISAVTVGSGILYRFGRGRASR